jgi:hypothetical protein
MKTKIENITSANGNLVGIQKIKDVYQLYLNNAPFASFNDRNSAFVAMVRLAMKW